MTSLLTNTTDALLMSMIVSAATTGPTVRHGDVMNEFSRPFNATRSQGPGNEFGTLSDVPEFGHFPRICNGSRCSDDQRSNNTGPLTFAASFDGSHFHLDENSKSTGFTYVVCVLAGTATTLACVGNLVVITAIAIEPNLRHSTNYFLVSLALSDLWIGLASMPLYTHYMIYGHWTLGRLLCDIWLCLDWIICTASQYTVFFITLDRYLSVKATVKYRNWRTDNKIIVMIAIAWIVPSCVFPPLIMGFQKFGFVEHAETECEVPFMTDAWFAFAINLLYFWVFQVLMCYFYWKIYDVVRALSAEAKARGNNEYTSITDLRTKTRTDEVSHYASHTRFTNKNNNLNKTNNKNNNSSNDGENRITISNSNRDAQASTQSTSNRYAARLANAGVVVSSGRIDGHNSNYYNIRDDDMGTEVDSVQYSRASRSSKASRASRPGIERCVNQSEANQTSPAGGGVKRHSGHTLHFADPPDPVNETKASNSYFKPSMSTSHDRKALRTISLVLGAFVICWSPYHAMTMLPALCGYDCVHPYLYQLTYWMCYLNSPINPFLYAYANEKFKVTMIRVLRCQFR